MKLTDDELVVKYVIFESFANTLIIRKFFLLTSCLDQKQHRKVGFVVAKATFLRCEKDQTALRNGPYCNAKRTLLQFESVFTAFLSDIFRLADSISLKF